MMDGRTKFVVGWLALLYVFIWAFSLSEQFDIHFWDRKYALAYNRKHFVDADICNSTAFGENTETFYSNRRYIYLVPHVLGAIFWWNLYFLQLIPKVRHAFDKKFHRVLGRCLMICALVQTTTGVGLALTSDSNIILFVSLMLAVAVFFCIYHAWKNAYLRDIPKHKYWVLRLVGYLQTISFARFWVFVLITSNQAGWYGLYPELNADTSLEDTNRVVYSMYEDSFILSILTAFIGTEWYLSGMQGMLDAPVPSVPKAAIDLPPNETQALFS